MQALILEIGWQSSEHTGDARDMDEEPTAQALKTRLTVTVKPSSYQPSKAELEADMSIDTTPEKLAQAIKTTTAVQENKR